MKTYEDDKKYLLNIYKRYPIVVKRAKGMYIYANGKKYLDMFSSLSTNSLGHRNLKVIFGIEKQLRKYLHLSNYFVSKPSVKLAELLIKQSFASKVMFTNSGTEANEAALKLVRLYGKENNKREILTLKDSFHGRTYGGMSLTGQKKKTIKFAPLLSRIRHITRNDIKELRERVNENTVAIFIELIQGEGGVNQLTKEYVDEIVSLREKYNFLIVVDEIQTGLLRTGLLFAYMHYKFIPDIVTLAKSLGGGLPLGAMLVGERLENILSIGDHGTTFGGNPLACSAGYALVKEVSKFKLYQHVYEMSNYFFDSLNCLKIKYPALIKDVRGKGLMIGIEMDCDIEKLKEELLLSYILINFTNINIIRLLPALIIKKKHIDYFISEFDRILQLIEDTNV